MSKSEADVLFAKGLEAIEHDHLYLARTCLEQALELERRPEICSYLALCRAKTRGQFSDSIVLAQEAITATPDNAVFYLNLGRIHLLAGDKSNALDTFRSGIRFEKDNEILHELEMHGNRRPPVFPALERSHPLNRLIGIILSRLGLR